MTTSQNTSAHRTVADDFESLLRPFDLDALDSQKASIYGLRRDLTIAYVNAYWVDFALQNLAPDALIDPRKFIGQHVLDQISGPLRDYYKNLYRFVLNNPESATLDYECSSPDTVRFFHMEILPLNPIDGKAQGLLVINSLSAPLPNLDFKEPICKPTLADYLTDSEHLVNCSNCRRFRRRDDPDQWDWIPCYLNDPPAPISHGLCTVCLDYYHPAPIDDE